MQTFFSSVAAPSSLTDYLLLFPAVLGLVFSICAFIVSRELIFLKVMPSKKGWAEIAAAGFVAGGAIARVRGGEYFTDALLEASAIVGVLLIFWAVLWLAGASKSVHRMADKLHIRKQPAK